MIGLLLRDGVFDSASCVMPVSGDVERKSLLNAALSMTICSLLGDTVFDITSHVTVIL